MSRPATTLLPLRILLTLLLGWGALGVASVQGADIPAGVPLRVPVRDANGCCKGCKHAPGKKCCCAPAQGAKAAGCGCAMEQREDFPAAADAPRLIARAAVLPDAPPSPPLPCVVPFDSLPAPPALLPETAFVAVPGPPPRLPSR